MRLSIETYALRDKFDDKTAIRLISEAGFDAYDYSFYWANRENDMLGEDYRLRARDLRAFSDALGIVCNQAHAPVDFRSDNKADISDPQYLRIVRSIEFAAILGAKNIVIHAITYNLPEYKNFYDYNREYYKSFIPYCEKFGINISVENLFNWESNSAFPRLCDPKEHSDFILSLNSGYFNACLDLGHSAVTGNNPAEVIKQMDSRLLKVLHIHDNYRHRDLHLLPYMGDLNWDEITAALAQVGYKGDFTFELTGYLTKIDNALLPQALKFAEQIGRFLINKINK